MNRVTRLLSATVPRSIRKRVARRTQARRMLAHPLVNGLPQVSLLSRPADDRPDRVAFARRLINAYRAAKADEKKAKLQLPIDDLWTDLINKHFGQLLEILDSEHADGLAKYLLQYGEQYTIFGGLSLAIDAFNPTKDPGSVALSYLDKLVCLSESLGVLPLENPEQRGRWGQNLYLDIGEILDGIEKEIRISIVPPAGAVFTTGLNTGRGPLHYRHINSLYAALRIKTIVPNKGSICEYGGGLGIVAYYANKLGFLDYTIFDLPFVNVFSGHYLLNSLGSEAVSLYGEASKADTVKVLPFWECMNVPSLSYSLTLNQDSMAEIDPSLVKEYLRQIERTTQNNFLSINQEAQGPMGSREQNSVPNLVRDFPAFHRHYRMKYWIREGYIEELYELQR